MQLTLSSKGQLVLPAPVRRRLRLKPRAKLELEERDGGVFLRPARRTVPGIEPIDYPPPGAIKLDPWEHDLMRRSSDAGPADE
jgi:AbrB family looped-hinge helix DNA binding protein